MKIKVCRINGIDTIDAEEIKTDSNLRFFIHWNRCYGSIEKYAITEYTSGHRCLWGNNKKKLIQRLHERLKKYKSSNYLLARAKKITINNGFNYPVN